MTSVRRLRSKWWWKHISIAWVVGTIFIPATAYAVGVHK